MKRRLASIAAGLFAAISGCTEFGGGEPLWDELTRTDPEVSAVDEAAEEPLHATEEIAADDSQKGASRSALWIPPPPPVNPTRVEIWADRPMGNTVIRTISLPNGGSIRLYRTTLGLRWIDNCSNETSYRVMARFSYNTGIAGVGTITSDWMNVATRSANTEVAAFDFDLPNNATAEAYVYCIANGAVHRCASNVALRIPQIFPAGHAFPAPTNGAATALNCFSIRVTWTDNHAKEPDDIVYIVENGDGLNWSTVATVPPNRQEAVISGLPAGIAMSLRVRSVPIGEAVLSGRFSPSAPTTPVFCSTPMFALDAPTGFSATAISSTEVRLAWTAGEPDKTGIVIEHAPGGVAPMWTALPTLAPSATSLVVGGLNPSSLRQFRMKYISPAGNSPSVSASANTANPTTIPAAPNSMTAVALSVSNIRLTWRDNSNNETHFKLDRRVAGGTWGVVANSTNSSFLRDPSDANIVIFEHSGAVISASTTYEYRVRASNIAGESANATVTVTTPQAPASATLLRVNNYSAYALVSLSINGVERLGGLDSIPAGNYRDIAVNPGAQSITVRNGFQSGGAEVPLYTFGANVNCASGATSSLNINNPPIEQILTRFTSQPRQFVSVMLVGIAVSVETLTIWPDGSYTYVSGDALVDQGYVSVAEYPGNQLITVRFHGDNYLSDGLFDETPSADGSCSITLAGLIFTD